MAKYYRTNENVEAIESLEFVTELLSLSEADITKWKWIIIALHNSLQNFMVCSLRGTNNLNVLAKKSAKEWFSEFTKRMIGTVAEWKSPEEKLDWFPSLFKKIQSDLMLMYTFSKKFVPSDSQKSTVIDLNYLRNEFIHFVPKSWSLPIDEIPNLILEILSIIEFLAFESKNIVWLDDNYPTRIQVAIRSIKEKINID